MNFDDNGNIVGGIINNISLPDVHRYLVTPFGNSQTRERNYSALLDKIAELEENITNISKIWLDGSFCTNKQDPNDIDMIIFIKPSEVGISLFQEISANHDIMKENHLDIYVCFDKDFLNPNDFTNTMEYRNTYSQFDHQEKYWMGQFGFDRNKNHKAILEINLEGGGSVG